ncbi:MAG: M1 family aminopeptidase, partial [Gemmatimonadota bacterium]
ADQVVGATGVPLSGDPGWRSASSSSAPEPMYQRAWYGVVAPPRSPPRLFRSDEAAPGRKRVRFYAEQVHHFAWSVDPAFLYEGGLLEARTSDADPVEISIHVLYRPGDEATWGGGIALERTIGALRWLEEVFGSYPYPQLTNLHRLEGGGTEFPMLVMNGSASEGLIFHEVSHQYVHGILANNEWREAWLDEGFAEFLTTWFQERQVGPGVWTLKLERAAMLERSGIAEPVGTPAEEFSSFPMYGAMAYTKASLIFRMLRELLGEDTFRLLLREYYARYRLRHVTEDDLRGLADEVSGRSLGWFFDAWLHGTETLDYAIGDVEMEVRADGTWRTFVEIHRLGGIWMPIAVRVDDVVVMAESREPRQLVEVVTRQRPRIVELDPAALLLEADRSNNRVRTGR